MPSFVRDCDALGPGFRGAGGDRTNIIAETPARPIPRFLYKEMALNHAARAISRPESINLRGIRAPYSGYGGGIRVAVTPVPPAKTSPPDDQYIAFSTAIGWKFTTWISALNTPAPSSGTSLLAQIV